MGFPLNDPSVDKFASKDCGEVVYSNDRCIEQATEQGTI